MSLLTRASGAAARSRVADWPCGAQRPSLYQHNPTPPAWSFRSFDRASTSPGAQPHSIARLGRGPDQNLLFSGLLSARASRCVGSDPAARALTASSRGGPPGTSTPGRLPAWLQQARHGAWNRQPKLFSCCEPEQAVALWILIWRVRTRESQRRQPAPRKANQRARTRQTLFNQPADCAAGFIGLF